jgi:hypothetical protein
LNAKLQAQVGGLSEAFLGTAAGWWLTILVVLLLCGLFDLVSGALIKSPIPGVRKPDCLRCILLAKEAFFLSKAGRIWLTRRF